MTEFRFAKTNDRSLLGSLNEFQKCIQDYDRIGRFRVSDPLTISAFLGKMIVLGMKEYPFEKALELFGCTTRSNKNSNVIEINRIPRDRNRKS